jgi:MFS transporter, SP family, sugar:H+ symporter
MKFNRESLGLSTHVHYDKFNPNSEKGTDVRHSLAGLDYSPLRRVTWRSFNMGILISMGGFM